LAAAGLRFSPALSMVPAAAGQPAQDGGQDPRAAAAYMEGRLERRTHPREREQIDPCPIRGYSGCGSAAMQSRRGLEKSRGAAAAALIAAMATPLLHCV
jgi:hypothetical protein